MRSVEACGVCTSVSGGAGPTATLPLQNMYLKGVRYEIGRVHACSTAPAVLDLVKTGRLDPGRVVSEVMPFSGAIDGMLAPVPKVVFVNDLD